MNIGDSASNSLEDFFDRCVLQEGERSSGGEKRSRSGGGSDAPTVFGVL